ncbi:MAG: YhbY family RNA-binding protein [Gammaproteobacteria bacterium]|nr:YhbY family RNA-binding protein [Gammaproteobacteria bacterium]
MSEQRTKLTERQRKHLRGLAHGLQPVARLGSAGVTDAFLAELEAQLSHHELLKLRVTAADRSARDLAIEAILARTGADLVTRIGNVAVLYRRAPGEPRLVLPGA